MKSSKTYVAIVCAALFLCLNQLSAQMYTKGQQDLHLGVGLGATLYGSGYRSILPPISVSYEKGVTDKIGVGGYLGYASSRYDYDGFGNDDYHWRYTYIIIGARGAYHYDLFKVPKLDTYGGLMLGYALAKAKFRSDNPDLNDSDYTSPTAGGFTWSGFLGARYQFREKFGAYAELGYGVVYLNVGVRVKL